MRIWFAISAMMAMAAGAAIGGPSLYPVEDCNKADTQYDLNVCAGDNYAAADKALNEAYRALFARLPDAMSRTDLRDGERIWIKRRDKDCADEVGPQEEGGSIWSMEMSNCLERETAARLRELKNRLDCLSSAKTCPR